MAIVDRRVVFITIVSAVIGLATGVVAQVLLRLIGFITNLAFYGRFSLEFTSPAGNHLGLWVILIPPIGGLIVGVMARYGAAGIRGHGIPEVMEQVLRNRSVIMPRLTWLKPLSAAIAIGTGGPFGAEGPIIATGGAMGSLIGQLMATTDDERKTLLAAGAAAGMAATFGSPVSGVLIAVELLLFEFRPRSLIPVMFACATAAAFRMVVMGTTPIFEMPSVGALSPLGLLACVMLGLIVGIAAVGVTRAVYLVEDGFALLPLHWMWWPAIGAVAVGVIGYWVPRTLGVGYENIRLQLSGTFPLNALILLCVFKCASWVISLSSGTSGGTLAPLFIIGGALGAALGGIASAAFPGLGLDARIGGLIGMAAMFTGASRALLTSIVFAFETTLQPFAVLPLAVGCTAAYLISGLLMEHTIMTEKVERHGIHVPADYSADFLSEILVRDVATYRIVALHAAQTLREVHDWISSNAPGSEHHGFPVLDPNDRLLGMVTSNDLAHPNPATASTLGEIANHPFPVAFEDNNLREAMDLMAEEGVGRLPVIKREDPDRIVAVLSGSDIRRGVRRHLEQSERPVHTIHLHRLF
jgi:chloride channel protein, CIC family